jgi:hypothetical protein
MRYLPANAVFHVPVVSNPKIPKLTAPLRGASLASLDCVRIAKFAASVFWRAHVARRRRIDALKLWNPQAEKLRQFILGQGPLPVGMCITMMVVVDGEAISSVHGSTLTTPTTGKKGEDSVHQFVVAGLLFNLCTGQEARHNLCLAGGPNPHVTFIPWTSVRHLVNVTNMIPTATPKGRLAALRDRDKTS